MNTLLLWPLFILQMTFPSTEVLGLLESGRLVFSENAAEVPLALKQQIGAGKGENFVLLDEWKTPKGVHSSDSAPLLIFYASDPTTRNCLLYYQDHSANADCILVYGKFSKSSGDYSLAAIRFRESDTKGDKSVNGLIQRIEQQKFEELEAF